jgi:hypothetical protein
MEEMNALFVFLISYTIVSTVFMLVMSKRINFLNKEIEYAAEEISDLVTKVLLIQKHSRIIKMIDKVKSLETELNEKFGEYTFSIGIGQTDGEKPAIYVYGHDDAIDMLKSRIPTEWEDVPIIYKYLGPIEPLTI